MSSAPAIADGLPESLSRWPGYLLAFIAERSGAHFEAALAPYGIRTRHASVLSVIDAEGPMSQRALGRRLRIDKSPMVIVVDELERLGYAERRRSAADRRVQDIHLTRAGRSALERVVEVAESENERTFEVLDDDERGQLHDLLLRTASASRDDPAA